MNTNNNRLHVSEMQKDDLPFLFEFWHNPKVMQYADEFPYFRGWSKSDDLQAAWKKYQENRRLLGDDYMQLMLRLKDSTPIGESFYSIHPEERKFIGRWKKPKKSCFVGDIKLLPPYWGQGLGTEGMRLVVTFVFSQTACEIFVVPPHKDNPAAKRVYEKAGFVPITGKSGNQMMWASHLLMKLTKERFKNTWVEISDVEILPKCKLY